MEKTLLKAIVAPILMVMMTTPVFAEGELTLDEPNELATITADVEVTEGYDLADPVYYVEYTFGMNSAEETFDGSNKEFYFKYNESTNIYTWDPMTLSYELDENNSYPAEFEEKSLMADVTFTITNRSNVAIHYNLEFDGNSDNFTSSFDKKEISDAELAADLACLYSDAILNDGSYTNKVNIENVDTKTVAIERGEEDEKIQASVDGILTVTANNDYAPTENVQDVQIGVFKLTISAVDYVN